MMLMMLDVEGATPVSIEHAEQMIRPFHSAIVNEDAQIIERTPMFLYSGNFITLV